MRSRSIQTPRALTVAELLLVTSIAVSASASSSPEALVSLFPFQAEISAQSPGLSRLELPPEVLERCRADMSDLRIFDEAGRETPYVVLDRQAGDPAAELIRQVTPEVLSVERSEDRPERGPARFLETYVVEVPELPPGAGSWELELLTARRELVARIDLWTEEASGARATLLEQGSAFRLQSPRAERLRFSIPIDSGRLGVDLVSEHGSYLAPRLRLRAVRDLAGPSPSHVSLEILEVRQRDGETEIVVDRPRGLLPAALRLSTSTTAFNRTVTVWDEGPNASPEPLGRATLLRLDAVVPVKVDELDLEPARGDRLRVVIENLDSPPLTRPEIEAVVTRPVLLFSLPEPGRTATLRFGGARARRPRYDLATAAPQLGSTWSEDRADQMRAFLEPERSGLAELGVTHDNPLYDPAPALGFAMHPGAELDIRRYSHQRRLEVEPSSEGLSRLRLTPEDQATIRNDLADLRVVDSEDRQWAYLLEREAASSSVGLELVEQRSASRRSIYRMHSSVGPIAVSRLELDLNAPFFDRSYRLEAQLDGGQIRVLSQGRLVRHQGDPRPQVLRLGPSRIDELELTIEDGDDAPLELVRAEVSTPVADLFLAAPAGSYTLLLGFPDASAPRYELERVRSTVLAASPGSITAQALEQSPRYKASSRLATSTGAQQILLWLAIGLAVVVLIVLTLRLARQEGGSGNQ